MMICGIAAILLHENNKVSICKGRLERAAPVFENISSVAQYE